MTKLDVVMKIGIKLKKTDRACQIIFKENGCRKHKPSSSVYGCDACVFYAYKSIIKHRLFRTTK